ncbi:MAG: type I-E CRISPR-associated endoribonuclease Cas2e [Oscillospiraceae bacterium]|nr:type I-E CRISPR-associated endoribonuclease Cas2e [Oscillospiraceae bacterium]
MIVVCMTKCPPKLRGDLSKWLLEINTGVYVGQVSARVREALWKRICDHISDGQATMVFSAQNEQHMDFYVHNTSWKPVDFDGIKLMKHLEKNCFSSQSELKPGFSNAAKREMGRKRRNSLNVTSYVLIDIETTGLSPENDDIIEIGALEINNDEVSSERGWLIQSEKNIPIEIQKLTGIDNVMIEKQGVWLSNVLNELFELIRGKNVFIYNASFDLSFLENSAKKYGLEFPEIHVKDILSTAKSRIKGLDNYRLETVSSYLGIEKRQCHRALDDCRMLYEVCNKLNKIG